MTTRSDLGAEDFAESSVVLADDPADYENRTFSISPDDPDWKLMPRLIRFYGLSFEELWRFPRWMLIEFYEQIEPLSAQEQLLAMQVSDFPHIPQKDRAKIHRDMLKSAGLYREAPVVAPTKADDIKKVMGMGINVVFEQPKKPAAEAEEVTLDA